MRQKLVPPPAWARVVALAEHQHGVVTRAEVCGLGMDDAWIRRRVRDGRLHRIHQGVYAVGRPTLTTHGRFLAAVVSCGPEAALSHFAAAALAKLMPERGPRIDVTAPRGGQRRRRGAVIVHHAVLPEEDVAVTEGIRVTTPRRTIVDLADFLRERQLERLIDEADYLGLPLDGLQPRVGRRGSGRLARVLDRHEPGSTRTRSRFEERMLELCRRFELPAPDVNQPIHGYTADFVWREARLIVETDGWRAHRTRTAFERDRRRDADLLAAGWPVVRITWAQLTREPHWVARRIREALELS
jgi:very-short-patch-repair endonuclease